jgi:hypothetical protein
MDSLRQYMAKMAGGDLQKLAPRRALPQILVSAISSTAKQERQHENQR